MNYEDRIGNKNIIFNTDVSGLTLSVEAVVDGDIIASIIIVNTNDGALSIEKFSICGFGIHGFTKEELQLGLKGLGRKIMLKCLTAVIKIYSFNRDTIITSIDVDTYPILEKIGFEYKDGVLYQRVGLVIDELKTQLGNPCENGFSPIASGTYGCVFYPHLLSKGDDVDSPRDSRLISKLMTLNEATIEHSEQKSVKKQLRQILKPELEEEQYIFSIGGVQEIGPVTEDDLDGYEKNCANFLRSNQYDKTILENDLTRGTFRKLDGINGGADLSSWGKKMTPEILRDMLYAFGKDDGLLDAIVKMNNAGVVHSDMKDGNLVWKGGDNPIGIIDWGLASTGSSAEWRRGYPINVPMYNTPLVSAMFHQEFQGMMDNFNVLDVKTNQTAVYQRVCRALVLEVVNAKKESGWTGTHLYTHITILNDILKMSNTDVEVTKIIEDESKPYGLKKSEKLYITVLSIQLMSIYRIHPDAIGGSAAKFWDDVFKYNIDIWGAMTTFTGIARELYYYKPKGYGNLKKLYSILRKVVVSGDLQINKIDVEELKMNLLEAADEIPIENDDLFLEAMFSPKLQTKDNVLFLEAMFSPKLPNQLI